MEGGREGAKDARESKKERESRERETLSNQQEDDTKDDCGDFIFQVGAKDRNKKLMENLKNFVSDDGSSRFCNGHRSWGESPDT